MCYSARIKQHLHYLERRYGAEIDWPLFEALFNTRLQDSSIKIARALEANFDAPETAVEARIREQIVAFRAREEAKWQTDVFKQKKRLADAERALMVKETRKARDDVRIATDKIAKNLERLANLHRSQQSESDSQIFPLYYAPVIIQEDDRRLIRPMRYTCRPPANRRASISGFPGPTMRGATASMVSGTTSTASGTRS